jgi:hypothetical protein
MTSKSGVFIGEALIENPLHPIEKISFKNVCIEEDGLLRILEASNSNKSISALHLGFVSSRGLRLIAKTISKNCSIKKLKF